jgi:hypothetical protein
VKLTWYSVRAEHTVVVAKTVLAMAQVLTQELLVLAVEQALSYAVAHT